ncbi:MAG: DAK2 domain-containing protein [Eubacteriales bacterium]|nr:DAK2 domain-containing protein [Eubacteriales bacterium]
MIFTKVDLLLFLEKLKDIMEQNRGYLIDLDSVVGDGDLGLTMGDGFAAAFDEVAHTTESDLGKILYQAGKAMSIKVPSTMGTLMASGFMQAGKELKGKTELKDEEFVTLFQAYFDGVAGRGKAKVGEKTFLDGLYPAVESLKTGVAKGKNLPLLVEEAAIAAEKGFQNTTTMIAVHGRAATRGEESRKLEDPGAAVAMLMMRALKESI